MTIGGTADAITMISKWLTIKRSLIIILVCLTIDGILSVFAPKYNLFFSTSIESPALFIILISCFINITTQKKFSTKISFIFLMLIVATLFSMEFYLLSKLIHQG